jgi:hypothetical protein
MRNMLKSIIPISIAIMLLFTATGCYEQRYYHEHHYHTADYYHRHNTPPPPGVDIDIHN